jgi:hypothetical protein
MAMRFAILLAAVLQHGAAHAAQCQAVSGERTAALVELYTSEGCDSCPPADRWLSSLAGRGYAPGRVVPIALHVDYWDYIGWKDPYGQARFSARQRKLAQLTRNAIVYTPQVLLQGRDFRRWGSPAFDEAVSAINARPARAKIALAVRGSAAGSLEVEASAELLDASQKGAAALYVAASQSKLVSKVGAGENRGRILEHDNVVFEWLGPHDFGPGMTLRQRFSVPLPPRAAAGQVGVAAFVQNRGSAEVLQALMLAACPG